jgi:A/G-specific adenine glycosylase
MRRSASFPTATRCSPRSDLPVHDPRLALPNPVMAPGWAAVAGAGVIDRHALLAWAAIGLRDLPWRRTRDPWAVLVSEVMAQSTGVDRVVPYYHSFLERFPDPEACAGAGPGEVVRVWAGLGYNRRAINLHRCATRLVVAHDGRVPANLHELLALPGVGPYTARAVLAFAFEKPVGVLDTNVGRVLARWADRSLGRAEAQALADSLVPPGRAWDWNQAVMELGATVCQRQRPVCAACPVRGGCGWYGTGLATPDPADGSAGVGQPQSRFQGSDRQGRGRLVDALRRGPVSVRELPQVMGWPDDPRRAVRVAGGIVADGLAIQHGDVLHLPQSGG